ncbi:MAG: hypothetical protein CFE39_11440 [Comamonadaceae bacterium PBBC2]|nr:MAG: hypothetical protein CFE39_11440 [Comamonadaceae bacterium PBBC2]
MDLNFMQIGHVVLSGKGIEQSMAFHAYQTLSAWSFALQLMVCVLSIGAGYAVRIWALPRMRDQGVWARLMRTAVQTLGPVTVAVSLMAACLSAGHALGMSADELVLVSRVLRLSLWVCGIRAAGWVLRHVMHPHGILRIFLHLIEWAIVGAVVLTFLGLLLPAIDKINAIEFAIGSQVFKGGNIVTGLMMAVVALTIAGQLSEFVAMFLRRYASRQNLQANDALILTRFFSFIIFTLTVVGVLVESGIDLTTLAAFGGAMGIGLGFGLQEFVVNFFSGLSVLMERALKVGDYVTINEVTGRVVHMSSRAVVVRDRVGTESLIPNSNVMKGILQNHTMSNDAFRMSIPLKIVDVADYPRARDSISQVLTESPRVLQTPAPQVLIKDISDTEITLEVSFWIHDLDDTQNELVSEMLYGIAMRLRADGIALASDGTQALLATMA